MVQYLTMHNRKRFHIYNCIRIIYIIVCEKKQTKQKQNKTKTNKKKNQNKTKQNKTEKKKKKRSKTAIKAVY